MVNGQLGDPATPYFTLFTQPSIAIPRLITGAIVFMELMYVTY